MKTHYLNIFTLPEGEDLYTKCIVDKNLDKHNSCILHLKKIARAVLKALQIFNAGKRFYKHGNLYPNNIYLYEKKEKKVIFIDNMLFDSVKYDDPNNKPFKTDFNLLADLLVNLLSGSIDFRLKDPKNTFDVYAQIKKYYMKNKFPINLKSFHLNMPPKFMNTPKCVTISELDYLLRNTFFNFVYRLKCTGTNKAFRFVEISQALKHGFVFKGEKEKQKWNDLPAEY